MRRTEIITGESYAVKTSYGRGRALVNGGPGMYRGKYHWSVLFPDAIPGQRADGTVDSRGFIHRWTEADETLFSDRRREEAEMSAISQGLVAAGYEPCNIRAGGEWIAFSGDTVKAVVETLLAHPRLRSDVLETIKAGAVWETTAWLSTIPIVVDDDE